MSVDSCDFRGNCSSIISLNVISFIPTEVYTPVLDPPYVFFPMLFCLCSRLLRAANGKRLICTQRETAPQSNYSEGLRGETGCRKSSAKESERDELMKIKKQSKREEMDGGRGSWKTGKGAKTRE